MFAFVPFCLAYMVEPYLNAPAATLAISLAIAAGGGWMAFALWRAWRLLRAYSVRRDRSFDQRGKFMLAADYHHSDSAGGAKQMRRMRRRR